MVFQLILRQGIDSKVWKKTFWVANIWEKSKSELTELTDGSKENLTYFKHITLDIHKTSQFTKPFPTLESHFISVRGRREYPHFIYKHAGSEGAKNLAILYLVSASTRSRFWVS